MERIFSLVHRGFAVENSFFSCLPCLAHLNDSFVWDTTPSYVSQMWCDVTLRSRTASSAACRSSHAYLCRTWLIRMGDSSICDTCATHMYALFVSDTTLQLLAVPCAPTHVTWVIQRGHDSFIYDMTQSCVMHMWVICESYVRRIRKWHDTASSAACCALRTYTCDMSHSYRTWLIHIWHDSIICESYVSHMWVICTPYS